MKKLFILTFTLLTIIQGQVQALLPPLYHTQAEFKAVIEDKQLLEKLQSGEAIISITRLDNSFKVLTTQHRIVIDVVYDKTDRIGPAQFHLVVHDPQPR